MRAFTYPFTVRHRRSWSADEEEIFPFRVRSLTRLEYQCWLLEGEAALEERLLRETVLEHPETFQGQPWDWEQVYAGVVQQVLDHILTLSGFQGEPHPEILARADAYLQGQEARFDLMIMAAFDRYGLEDLLDMPNELWHRLVGQAQCKLAILGIDAEAILDPESYQKKNRRRLPPPQAPDFSGAPTQRGAQRTVVNEGALSFTAGK